MNLSTWTAIAVGLTILTVGLIPSYLTIAEIVRIHRTPTSFIAGLPYEGPAEIYARAEGKKYRSPITHSECVFWHVLVKEDRSHGRAAGKVIVFQEISSDSFILSDETGTIQVKVAGGDAILYDKFSQTTNLIRKLDNDARHAVRELGFNTKTIWGRDRDCQIFERIIPPGKKVYVQGKIDYEDGSRILTSMKGVPVIFSDRNERNLLQTLYWRVAANLGILAAIAGAIFFCSYFSGK